MTQETIIDTRDLWKIYKEGPWGVEALKGVNLKIKKGDSVAVVGVSGSGKSTLLHILGTLDRPTRGEVYFCGENVFRRTEPGLATFRNYEIGFVFQFHYLLPEFTALENVMMPALIRGIKRGEAKELAEGLLVRLGLGGRLHHTPSELSGGEQQGVAVGRAAVLKPKVFLADEPTGNLDSETSRGVLDLLIELNLEYGTSLIMVTHDEALASRLDRRIRLSDGRIIHEN